MLAHSSNFWAFLVVFGGLLSFVSAAGWTLDESCSAVADQLTRSMDIAFRMAEAAAAKLDQSPIDNNVLTVYKYLFLDTDDVRNNKVKKVFKSISGMSQKVDKNIHDTSTVIIYCNFKRLQPGKSPDYLWDSDILVDIKNVGETKKYINQCKSSNPIVNPSQGYLEAFSDSLVPKIAEKASQIQICPWYLDHVFKGKFDESKGFKMRHIAFKVWEKIFAPFTATQIDGLADFPVTMLHELAHTREAGSGGLFGGNALDPLGYGIPTKNEEGHALIRTGWKKITKDVKLGHTNADNYAYFGLAINRMMDGDNPYLVQADGSMQLMPAALTRRLWKAFRWSA